MRQRNQTTVYTASASSQKKSIFTPIFIFIDNKC